MDVAKRNRSEHGPDDDEKQRAGRDSKDRRPTDTARTRSRSPRNRDRDRDRRRHHGRDRERDSKRERTRKDLPHAARHLTSADRAMFAPLLAHYLLTERGVAVASLRDDEKESRWKRFVDRWNHGGLNDRWYEPQLFLRVAGGNKAEAQSESRDAREEESDNDSDSDDYGPALPPSSIHQQPRQAGATLPTLSDLRERRELVDDDRRAQRSAARTADRLARRADRKQERERLDELVPRAAAGTRERQLEKKRERNDTLRSFRERSPGAAEVDDSELMGGGGGGQGGNDVDTYKRMLAATQKKKTEWEVRREEEQRARLAELDERRAQYRAREAETVEMLRVLARQRFGG